MLVLLIAMVFTACYGWTVEKLAYKPLRKSFRLAPLISALGMSIVLQNYVQAAQGARIKTLQPVIQGGFNFFKESDFVEISNSKKIGIEKILINENIVKVKTKDEINDNNISKAENFFRIKPIAYQK